jgi:hypothetical protein
MISAAIVRAAVLTLALAMLGVGAPARAAGPPIQPGVAIDTSGDFCTLAWLFQRAHETPAGDLEVSVFAATAAHCVHIVSEPVTLAADGTRIGEVAFIGANDIEGRDYAFVKIDPARYDQVNPAMTGHPQIPTGVSTSPQKGDLVQFSGWGLGFDSTAETRERRQGVLSYLDAEEHRAIGPVNFGDSGGPVADVTEGNTAFGIVSALSVGGDPSALTVVFAGEGGPNLSFMLADAAARGFVPGELCVAGQPCGALPA